MSDHVSTRPMQYVRDFACKKPMRTNKQGHRFFWVRGNDNQRYRCEVYRSCIEISDLHNQYITDVVYTDDARYSELTALLTTLCQVR